MSHFHLRDERPGQNRSLARSAGLLLLLALSPACHVAAGEPTGGERLSSSLDLHASSATETDELRLLVELRAPGLFEQATGESASGLSGKAQVDRLRLHREALQQAQRRLRDRYQISGKQRSQGVSLQRMFNLITIALPASRLEQLEAEPEVLRIHRDLPIRLLLNESVAHTGAPEVWTQLDASSRPLTGHGVTVAVIDSGIDYSHPDLGGCLGPGCKVIGGYDFANGDSDPRDDNGHGTHVAGIIGANGQLKGIAPNVSLLAYKVTNAQGAGTLGPVLAAIEDALDPDGDGLTTDHADVINLSLGAVSASDGLLAQAADRAVAEGAVVVAAAGNNGTAGFGTILSPGNAERVLTVGAISKSDQLAAFSSRGSVPDAEYVKPEVVAPGVSIRSTFLNGQYARRDGTSMAAPHVAGAAALLKQLHPAADPDLLKALLVNQARDLGGNLFVQGAGALWIPASMAARVAVLPAIPSFGLIQPSSPDSLKHARVRVRNFGTQAASLTFVATPGPPGLHVENLPPSPLWVGPGAEATLDWSLRVESSLLGPGTPESLHQQSAVVAQQAGSALRVPWSVFVADELSMDFSAAPARVWAFAESCPAGRSFCAPVIDLSDCIELRAQRSAPLRRRVAPGHYFAIAGYSVNPQDGCASAPHGFVFAENIDTATGAAIDLTAGGSMQPLQLGTIVTPRGTVVGPDLVQRRAEVVEIARPRSAAGVRLIRTASEIQRLDTLSPGELARFSAVSEQTVISLTTLLEQPVMEPEPSQFYLLRGRLVGTAAAVEPLGLGVGVSGEVDFAYADPATMDTPVLAMLRLHTLEPLVQPPATPFVSIGQWLRPFRIRLAAEPAEYLPGEYLPSLRVARLEAPATPADYTLVDSGPVDVEAGLGFAKPQEHPQSGLQLLHADPGNDLPLGSVHGPAFLAAHAVLSGGRITLHDPDGCFACGGLLRDTFQNLRNDDLDFILKCKGQPEQRGSLTAEGFGIGVGLCQGAIRLDLSMPARLFGNPGLSQATYHVNPDSASSMPVFPGLAPGIVLPQLEALTLLDDGRPSRLLDGDRAEILMRVALDPSVPDTAALPRVTIQYRLGAGGWIDLPVRHSAVQLLSADLPIPVGAYRGSLRITIEDAQGNRLEQQLNDLFLIGTDSHALAGAPPVFAALEPLRVETHAAFADYRPPQVYAMDPIEGALAARLDTPGPFPIGEHALKWSVRSAAGLEAAATQMLSVVSGAPSPARIFLSGFEAGERPN